MVRRNFYKHVIDLKKIEIKNDTKDEFAKKIIALKYRGYEVEEISDGRKIVITKPGGKRVRGSIKKEDIMVFIYSPSDDTLWQISHKNILDELKEKGKVNPKATIKILDVFEIVYNGEEPDKVLLDIEFTNPIGELP
ncbi:MAG: hypothetical protein PHU88_04025, partial [candidate division Zixibacteria bacterium]|nr:hypothetical protein [candidate division Zixibacteria bacterium]